MTLNNINSMRKDRGFTIVELLIVIVVIAILAAITIVAYNGIQSRAKTSSAQSAASNVVKKAEIYNTADTTTGYPATLTALTGAASTTTYAVTGVTAATPPLSSTTPQTGVAFYKCGVGAAGAATSAATVTNQTGVRVDYYDYSTSTTKSLTTGTTTGTVSTYNVTCWISNS